MSNPLRKGNVTAEKRNIDKNENSRNLFYRFRLFLFSERVSQKIKAVWISKRSFCCVKKQKENSRIEKKMKINSQIATYF